MLLMKIWGLTVLLCLCTGYKQACFIREVRKCQYYGLIQMIDFHAFIPVKLLDESCSHFQSALSCVYAIGRLNQCNPVYRLPFDTQRGVINAICGRRKTDYLRSALCFSKPDAKNRIIRQCMAATVNFPLLSRDPCGTMKWISDCARDIILMTDGCDSTDAALMVDLVDIYLQPTKDRFKCPALHGTTEGGTQEKSRETVFEKDVQNESKRANTGPEPSHLEKNVGITNDERQRTIHQNVSQKMNESDLDDSSDMSQTATSKYEGEYATQENAAVKEQLVTHKPTEPWFEYRPETVRAMTVEPAGSMSWETTPSTKQLDLHELIESSGHVSIRNTYSAAEPAERDWIVTKSSSAVAGSQDTRKTSEYSNQVANYPERLESKLNRIAGIPRVSKSTQGASNGGSRADFIASFLIFILIFHCLAP